MPTLQPREEEISDRRSMSSTRKVSERLHSSKKLPDVAEAAQHEAVEAAQSEAVQSLEAAADIEHN
jgi:hypothetical protein